MKKKKILISLCIGFLLLSPNLTIDLFAQCRQFYQPSQEFSLSSVHWKYSYSISSSQAIQFGTTDVNWPDAYLSQNWDSSKGSIWYRCFVYIETDFLEDTALYLGKIGVADKVYLNGNLLGQTGNARLNRYDPGKERLYTIPSRFWQRGDNLISIYLEGDAVYNRGVVKTSIANEAFLSQKIFLKDFPQIIICLVCFLLAVLIGLFYFSPNQKECLYLSIFSLCVGFYFLLQTWIRYEIFDSFVTSYVFERVFLFCCPPFFVEYLQQIVRGRRYKHSLLCYGVSGLLVVLIMVLPNSIVTWRYLSLANIAIIFLVLLFVIWLFWYGDGAKREHLHILKLGTITLFISVILDVNFLLFISFLPGFTSFGLLFFISSAFLYISKHILSLHKEMVNSEKQTRLVEKRKTHSIYNMSREFEKHLDSLSILLSKMKQGNEIPTIVQQRVKMKSLMQPHLMGLENLIYDSEILRTLESNNYIPKHVAFNIKNLCEDSIRKALLVTVHNKKRVSIHMEKHLPMVMGDSDLISLSFYHLIENALLYTEGKIECKLALSSHELKIEVSDEGPGINAENKEQVFQKFFRGDEMNPSVLGLGIGLTLVSLAVKSLGGQTVFKNNNGFFSRFILFIPVE